MSTLLEDELVKKIEQWKTSLLTLPQRISTYHCYLYFEFDHSPSKEMIKVIAKLKQLKILKRTHFFPVIIDYERKRVQKIKAIFPPQKVIENCFTQGDI